MKSGRENTVDLRVWQNGHHSAPQYSSTGRFSRLATMNAPCRLPSNQAISRGSFAWVACWACGGGGLLQLASISSRLRLRQIRRASMSFEASISGPPASRYLARIQRRRSRPVKQSSLMRWQRAKHCRARTESAHTLSSGALSGPAFEAAARQCLQRILRPVMLRVAAAHVLADLFIAAAPEAAQITRDLQRTLRGRQQLERQRHRAAADARGFDQAEHFLQPDCEARRIRVNVVDADVRAARHYQLSRCECLERAQLRGAEPGTQRLGERQPPPMLAARDARQPGRQPLLEARRIGSKIARPADGEGARR